MEMHLYTDNAKIKLLKIKIKNPTQLSKECRLIDQRSHILGFVTFTNQIKELISSSTLWGSWSCSSDPAKPRILLELRVRLSSASFKMLKRPVKKKALQSVTAVSSAWKAGSSPHNTAVQMSGRVMDMPISRRVAPVDDKWLWSRAAESRLLTRICRQIRSSFRFLSESWPLSLRAILKQMFFKSTLSWDTKTESKQHGGTKTNKQTKHIWLQISHGSYLVAEETSHFSRDTSH